MDKDKEEIVAKKIESGEYFQEAMSWFHVKFTRPRTEAAYFFIIALIALAAAGIGVAAFSRIFPLSPGYSFMLGHPIGPKDKIKIDSITKPGDSVNTSVVKYILEEYVRAREEYLERNLDKNYRIVTATSDAAVNSEYDQEMSMANPQNPIRRYSNIATREIEVYSIRLLDANGKPATDNTMERAVIHFASTITFLADNTQDTTGNEADITFQYDQIIVDQETGEVTQKPNLLITSYKTRSLETE